MHTRLFKFVRPILRMGSHVAIATSLSETWNAILARNSLKKEKEDVSADEQTRRVHMVSTLHQAYRDVGCESPIYVVFNKRPGQFNVENINFLSHFQNNVLVNVYYSEPSEISSIHNNYAIGGHEAVHAKHMHDRLYAATMGIGYTMINTYFKSFASMRGVYYVFPSIVSLWLASHVVQPVISRLCERDADISSAAKLGTAEQLSCALIGSHPFSSRFEEWTGDHPTLKTRLKYLQKLNPQQPSMFFSSKLYLDMKKQQEQLELKRLTTLPDCETEIQAIAKNLRKKLSSAS